MLLKKKKRKEKSLFQPFSWWLCRVHDSSYFFLRIGDTIPFLSDSYCCWQEISSQSNFHSLVRNLSFLLDVHIVSFSYMSFSFTTGFISIDFKLFILFRICWAVWRLRRAKSQVCWKRTEIAPQSTEIGGGMGKTATVRSHLRQRLGICKLTNLAGQAGFKSAN